MEVLIRQAAVPVSAWVAPGAILTGDVELGEEASVWFGCVLRGDVARIRIGNRTNVQDGCIFHVNEGQPCILGDDVTVGHGAIVHAATVEEGCLIGIRATILSGAHIGAGSIIGAGALVTEGKEILPGSMVLGVPGRVARRLSVDEQAQIRLSAAKYVAYSRAYLAGYK